MGKTYRINEIFYSIQGEGCYTGTAAVFVRFSGCNRNCSFCDTSHQNYTEMTATEIEAEVHRLFGCGWKEGLIVLTGGEPLLQLDDELFTLLDKPGRIVAIETNSSLLNEPSLERILSKAWVTASPKTAEDVEEAQKSKYIDEVKIVYQGQDLTPYTRIDAECYYLQPCSCQNNEEVIRKVMEDPLWRLSLQTQKILNLR